MKHFNNSDNILYLKNCPAKIESYNKEENMFKL